MGGDDYLSASEGNDTLYGQAGDDILYAGSGDDYVSADIGNDYVSGYDGNDTIYGGDGDDTLKGGNGNDTIYANDGNDAVQGDDGNDYLSGSTGSDTVQGGDGDDYLTGGDQNDILLGDSGKDTLAGGSGGDSLDGGSGLDSISGYNSGDQMIVNGHPLSGSIAEKWRSLGGESSSLGLPISGPQSDGAGGSFQLFSSGTVVSMILARSGASSPVVRYVRDALTLATVGPSTPAGQAILKKYADEGAAKLQAEIQTRINRFYAENSADWNVSRNWGSTATVKVLVGVRWDGSAIFQEFDVNHGSWSRTVIDPPSASVSVTYVSTNPATNAMRYHVAARVESSVWSQFQRWTLGAQDISLKVDGEAHVLVEFDIDMIPQVNLNPTTLQISVSFSLQVRNLDVDVGLTFGQEDLVDLYASYYAEFATIFTSGMLDLYAVMDATVSAESYFHQFAATARLTPSSSGLAVTVKWYYNGDLEDTIVVPLL